jgi:membrane-associated protein
MDLLHQFIDLFLHLDTHLDQAVSQYGAWVYLLLVVIVFCETGLVFTPILPGDSLLFAAGAIAERGHVLHPAIIIALLIPAALVGDNVNYFVGRTAGPRIFRQPKSWFFNPEHLRRTREFYERHGGKTIILARFTPIIRTCAPFIAGMGRMDYRRFLAFCVAAAGLWVPICVLAGTFFGEQEFVKKHFTLVILAIVAISLLPAIIGVLRSRGTAHTSGGQGI